MAVSDAQKRASDKYRRENVKQIGVRFYPDSMAEHERGEVAEQRPGLHPPPHPRGHGEWRS